MGRRLRQNDTNISEICIGCPISISDVQYLYPTSDIYIRHPSISDVRYLYPTSDILGLGQGYRTSDIDIGRQIYILDVRYRFRKHWWHFVLNGIS